MTIEWLEENWLDESIVQIQDGETIYSGYDNASMSPQQLAYDYADFSEDETSRTVMVRRVDSMNGFGQWVGPYTIPQPPPLTTLPWNGGNPTVGEIPMAHVVDDGASFNAINPQDWTPAQIAADYGSGFVEGTEVQVCENRTPHQITARVVYPSGPGAWETFTVP